MRLLHLWWVGFAARFSVIAWFAPKGPHEMTIQKWLSATLRLCRMIMHSIGFKASSLHFPPTIILSVSPLHFPWKQSFSPVLVPQGCGGCSVWEEWLWLRGLQAACGVPSLLCFEIHWPHGRRSQGAIRAPDSKVRVPCHSDR